MSTWQEKDDLELTECDFDVMLAQAVPVAVEEHPRLPAGAVLGYAPLTYGNRPRFSPTTRSWSLAPDRTHVS